MLPVIQSRLESPFDVFRELDRLVTNTACEVNHRVVGFPVDVYEANDALVFEAELPGYHKDQIEVSVEDDVLTISASTEAKAQVNEQADAEQPEEVNAVETAAPVKALVRERRKANRVRRFTVPSNYDPAHVDASLADGVLTLTLAKREEVKPRKVDIR